MKKLVMLLLAGSAAVLAQAASVNWVVSNVYTPNADLLAPGSTGGGAKMTTAEAANLIISVFWDSNKGSGDASWTLIDNAASLTAAGTKGTSVLWTQDTAVANRNDSGMAYYKVVLEYTSGGTTFTTEKLSGAVDLKNITSQAKAVTFNMNNLAWTSTGGGGGQGGGEGGGAPEPTSGLLLLVGAGVLGLRRKRA